MKDWPPYRAAPKLAVQECVHCGAFVRPKADQRVRWVCGECGKPVVPGLDAVRLDPKAIRALSEAGRLLTRKRTSSVWPPIGVLVFMWLGLNLTMGHIRGAAVVVAAAVFGSLAYAFRERSLEDARPIADEAWVHAAALLAQERGGLLTTSELSETTRITAFDAASLLAKLSEREGHIYIGGDQQVHYRAGEPKAHAAEPSPAPPSASPPDERAPAVLADVRAPYRVVGSDGLETCPNCARRTAALAHPQLRWVCGACGGPVIPGVDTTKLGVEATRLLREAAKAGNPKALRTFGGGALVFVILAAVFLLFSGASLTADLVFLSILSVFASVTFFTLGTRRARHMARARLVSEGAWRLALLSAVRARGGHLTAREAAQTMRIEVEDAKRLLTRLSVDRGRVHIDDAQQLHYRVDVSEPLDSEAPSASAKQANE